MAIMQCFDLAFDIQLTYIFFFFFSVPFSFLFKINDVISVNFFIHCLHRHLIRNLFLSLWCNLSFVFLMQWL